MRCNMSGVYKTDDNLTLVEANRFIRWFYSAVCTDHELNESASGKPDEYYIVFFELLPNEVQTIRDYENKKGYKT